MMIIYSDGSLQSNDVMDRASGRARDTIEVSTDLLAQQSDLFDRIFTLAFDVLELHTLEIRVCAAEESKLVL